MKSGAIFPPGCFYRKIPTPLDISRCHLGEKIRKVEEKKEENAKEKREKAEGEIEVAGRGKNIIFPG